MDNVIQNNYFPHDKIFNLISFDLSLVREAGVEKVAKLAS